MIKRADAGRIGKARGSLGHSSRSSREEKEGTKAYLFIQCPAGVSVSTIW